MEKQFLDKLGLEELMKLTIALDSEGDGISIEAKDHHKVLSVKYDDETLKLNSDGDLFVNTDERTLIKDSEGKLQTRVGGWLEVNRGEGVVVEGVFDKTATKMNEKALLTYEPFEYDLPAVNCKLTGKIDLLDTAAVIHTLSFTDSVVSFTDKGNYYESPDLGGNTIIQIHGPKSGEPNVVLVQNNDATYVEISEVNLKITAPLADKIHHIDNDYIKRDDTIVVDSEGSLVVPIDDNTIILNSEGKLQATFQNPKAIKPVVVSADGVISLTTSTGLKILNSEALAVDFDHSSIILDSEGRLAAANQVFIDELTIVKDVNDKLSVPFDFNTITRTSEGLYVAPRGIINDVELNGNKTTEDIKVVWYGTKEEYDAIAVKNPYTFYVINTSEGEYPTGYDYRSLINKPSINNIELYGNREASELGLQSILQSGRGTNVVNNAVNLKFRPGVLSINSSNELFADTYSTTQLDNILASYRAIKVVAVKPVTPIPNTIYYVESTTSGVYNVYLYDDDGIEHSLGTSNVAVYHAGDGITIDPNNVIYANLVQTVRTDGSAAVDAIPSENALVNFVFAGATASDPGSQGIVPKPAAGDNVKFLKGTGNWEALPTLIGATSANDGVAGIVPAPAKADAERFLRGDGTWATATRWNDVPYTELPLTNVIGGKVYYCRIQNWVHILIDGVQLNSVANKEIGTIPAGFRPKYKEFASVIAYNNDNAPAGSSVDANGALTLYGSTGQFNYWGSISFPVEA